MSSFNFNNTIPASGNDPSVDQPQMLINNQSTASIIDIDHIGFGQSSGGKHRQTRLLNLSSLPGGVANEGMLYVKTAAGVSSLFYRPDATTDQYQLTRTVTSGFTLFATNTNYPQIPPVANQFGGWTFLPGGMLLQYGIANVAAKGTSTTIKYPISFTGVPFSITIGSITGEGDAPGENNQFVKQGTVANTQFQVVNSSGSSARQIYWQAIGV